MNISIFFFERERENNSEIYKFLYVIAREVIFVIEILTIYEFNRII